MKISHDRLKKLVQTIFAAAGCRDGEAERIGHYLVQANLAGHDSHGVIRVSAYIGWLKAGKVLANQTAEVVFENEVIAIVDGHYGFGQVMGEEAMKIGIKKAGRHGVAVLALRNAGHIGRVGEWAEMAAAANKWSIHFVNTNGAGILVAPFGGINPRLSANPIAAGIPIPGRPPLILDISTCTIAEGKIRVALNKGGRVPPNCIVDAKGKPTDDPKAFYTSPPGAILPVGGHKGFGLGVITEMLAGALLGGLCSNPEVNRVGNNMLTIILDPVVFGSQEALAREAQRFIEYVRSSEKSSPDGEILMPGEFEQKTRASRLRDGIDLDDTTWSEILQTCTSVKLNQQAVNSIIGTAVAS